MTHREGWAVGMSVWAVYANGLGKDRGPVEAVITKIGRRWITFVPVGRSVTDRFDAETCHIDGMAYGSRGKVYPSLDEYHEQSECGRLWTEYRRALPSQPPEGMTSDRIKQLIEELE